MKKCIALLVAALFLMSSLAASTTIIGTRTLFANTSFCKRVNCYQMEKIKLNSDSIYFYTMKSQEIGVPREAVIVRNKANLLEDIRLFNSVQEWGKEYSTQVQKFLSEIAGVSLRFDGATSLKILNYKAKKLDVYIDVLLVNSKGDGEKLSFEEKILYELGNDLAIEIYFGKRGGLENYKFCCGGAAMQVYRVFRVSSANRLPKIYDATILKKQKVLWCKYNGVSDC